MPLSPDPSSVITDDVETEVENDVEHYKFRVSKNLTRRIDQYLVDRVAYLSRANVQRLIDEQLVKVNGHKTKASYHPKTGDEIEMVAPPEPVNEIVPEPIPLDVIYEDEHLMAINKQMDLLVHPARGKWTGTLVNGLVHYGQKWSTINGAWRPGILHRLDRNTTGVMLIAKSDEAHWRIARQFENRTIQKTYLAIAHGVPKLLSDVIDLPIGRDRYVREKQAIRKTENGGRLATTIYEVQEILPRNVADARLAAPLGSGEQSRTAGRSSTTDHDRFSLMKLTPKTGRTHQLRVHLSALGHPIVGDSVYGGRPFIEGNFRMERQALHAYEITFVHPGTLEKMTLRAPLPADISKLLDILTSSTSTRCPTNSV